jgi:hypothetical protein
MKYFSHGFDLDHTWDGAMARFHERLENTMVRLKGCTVRLGPFLNGLDERVRNLEANASKPEFVVQGCESGRIQSAGSEAAVRCVEDVQRGHSMSAVWIDGLYIEVRRK